jgi:glutaredoxin
VRATQPAKPAPPKPAARGRYESALPEAAPSIVLYVSDDCGAPCDEARKLLASRGVQANVVPVTDPATYEELERVSGGVTVPVLVAGTRVVKGFEAGQYNAALDSLASR